MVVSTREFRQQLAKYLDLIAQGEVVIVKNIPLHLHQKACTHQETCVHMAPLSQESVYTPSDTNVYTEEDDRYNCRKCGSKQETKKMWEDGEDFPICFNCGYA